MKKEVIITILVVILLIAGMVGYALYNNQKTKKPVVLTIGFLKGCILQQ